MNLSPARLPATIRTLLWDGDLESQPPWRRVLIWCGRLVYGVARKFVDNKLSMRAMSLVYTTLLSLVPLLAVSFAVLRAFGVHNQLEPALLEFLDPLGDKRIEITRQIVEFVENLRLGVLSSLGMSMLIFTIVSMTHKVEEAFNDIWHVAKPRSLARRFADYLSVILVGPVLVFSGLSMTRMALHSSVMQWLASIQPFGLLLYGVSQLVPYLVVCAAFTFIYGFIPNTRVRLTTALIGGVFAGLLWSTASMVFANLVVDSSNYSAIYAGFASVVLFMVWIYLGWMIILVGAQVTFYWQNPRFLDPSSETTRLSNREREELVLDIMLRISRAYQQGQPLWTRPMLEQHRPNLQPDVLQELLDLLEQRRLIVAVAGEPVAYLPARPVNKIGIGEVLETVRGGNDGGPDGVASALMREFDQAMENVIERRSVGDLLAQWPAPVRPAAEPPDTKRRRNRINSA